MPRMTYQQEIRNPIKLNQQEIEQQFNQRLTNMPMDDKFNFEDENIHYQESLTQKGKSQDKKNQIPSTDRSQTSPSDQEITQSSPIQLLKISQDLKKFELSEEGLKILRSIDTDIGIVAVTGAQRTGKSFILNLLLDQHGQKGFKISPSTKSCTQGIWIWGKPIFVKNRNMHIILLDTEGSGSLQKNQTHDSKIFALVVLLSSFFIFNSMQTIDENSISCLSVAAELSNFIKVKSSGNGEQILQSTTPKFLWLLRDFALELHENGRDITENEYLENRLSNFSKSTNERNKKVREALLKHFQQRELITLVRPVDEEDLLVKLDTLSWDQYRKEFRTKASILKHKVFYETPAKQMNNKCINGKILAALLWDNVLERETQRAFEKAQKLIEHSFKKISYPQEISDLLKIANDAIFMLDTQENFLDNKIDKQDVELKKKEIQRIIQDKLYEAKKKNLSASLQSVAQADKLAFKNIEDKLASIKNSYNEENLPQLQSDLHSYFKKLKYGATEGGGGPASLPFIKETFIDKIQQINKNLITNLNQKFRENKSNKVVDYEKYNEKLILFRDELEALEREEKIQQDKIVMMKSNFEQNEKMTQMRKDRLKQIEEERKKLEVNEFSKIQSVKLEDVNIDIIDSDRKQSRQLKQQISQIKEDNEEDFEEELELSQRRNIKQQLRQREEKDRRQFQPEQKQSKLKTVGRKQFTEDAKSTRSNNNNNQKQKYVLSSSDDQE
ncbi:guanylate-binding n-terminal domain containing protein [Stylonychia lemnae]|uniref:Guanylate-binding n-terminal domain containing protein n=1 Tax=Stylonychia lemnae TaxID=5949 RepID=A0A077ZM66_STYLE|nr:guanylate-binding n-terminal domain containing protein [Stylonychia lemnae]|eukprot:CDW71073.1 guanylate-binding n-terminal domain containing protein [Stylonychia lemnae]